MLRCVGLFAAPWTVAHQAPLSIEISRQEYRHALFEKRGSYPDFADGVSEALVVPRLAERDGIELPLVEVGHRALPLLLSVLLKLKPPKKEMLIFT